MKSVSENVKMDEWIVTISTNLGEEKKIFFNIDLWNNKHIFPCSTSIELDVQI